MKIIILILLFITNIMAENATKDDIKMLIHHIDKRFEQVDKQFEQVDKRFEQVDKRFESMQVNIDKRFEQVDKRFEQVDKKFESVQANMNKRFEQVDKKFESVQANMDKRFEQVDKKLDNQFYMIITFFVLMMGYLLKERVMIKTQVINELEPELIKKADKNMLNQVISIIEEMAKKDKSIEDILNKHHLKLT